MKIHLLNKKKITKGQALLEFALVMPIMLMLTLGMLQYGFVMNAMVALTHFAREGARYAAINPSSDTAITNYILAMAPAYIDTPSTSFAVSVTPTATSRVSGSSVTVSITYNMSQHMFVPPTLNVGFYSIPIFSKTITRAATMLIE